MCVCVDVGKIPEAKIIAQRKSPEFRLDFHPFRLLCMFVRKSYIVRNLWSEFILQSLFLFAVASSQLMFN